MNMATVADLTGNYDGRKGYPVAMLLGDSQDGLAQKNQLIGSMHG